MIHPEATRAPNLMEGELFSIRKVKTMEEVRSITEVIRKAWDLTDLENVATFEMKAVSDFGTVLMAAPNDTPDHAIGFIYAFPMFPDRNYSHMMGIHPDWQGKNVGFELKMVHRQLALEHQDPEVNEILWTVDPLLPNNAWLNFGKLGVICDTYKINYYGMPEGVGIYEGIPTDRFLVKWQIRSEKVKKAIERVQSGQHRVYPSFEEFIESHAIANSIEKGKYIPNPNFTEEKTFYVEMPTNYQWLRENRVDLAAEWRQKFREICVTNLPKGWIVSNYIRTRDEMGEFHNFYEFSKRS